LKKRDTLLGEKQMTAAYVYNNMPIKSGVTVGIII